MTPTKVNEYALSSFLDSRDALPPVVYSGIGDFARLAGVFRIARAWIFPSVMRAAQMTLPIER
jgi:hypothetical protein